MAISLFDIVAPSVSNHPERPAIIAAEGGHVSYRRLAELVDSLAAHAARAGISKGNHVAVIMRSRPTFFCMLLALSKLGAVRVPERRPGSAAAEGVRVDYQIVGAGSEPTGPGVVKMGAGWLEPPSGAIPMPIAGLDSPEDTAVILTSSGTTGRPKPLSFSLALMKQAIEDQGACVGALDRRTLIALPPHTSFGLEMALLTLRSGGQIIWPPDGGNGPMFPLLGAGRVDDIVATPVAYSRLVENLRARDIRLKSIRRAIMAGSVASEALIGSVQEFICRDLINNYGSSELGPCASSHVDEVAGIPGAVGKLVPWMDIRITDDRGDELPRGQTGLLQLRLKPGRRVATYVSASAGGAELAREWFVPGDMGSLTENGILCIQGRVSDLMNIGGTKIAPSAIEELANQFLGENETVAAFGLPGPNGFDEVAIAIQSRNASRIEGLRSHIKASNKIIDQVHIIAIEALPVNESGKVDRIILRDLAARTVAQRGSRT